MINGEKLALEQAGGKAGKYTIKYVSLDDSTAQPGTADAGQTAQNARKAAQDKTTIVYIGEFNSGAYDDLDPDPQRGGHPADQPGEHVRRPDHERAGLRAGRAGQVLPDRQAHVRAHRARATRSRAPRWRRVMKEDGCTKVDDLRTTRRSTAPGLAKQHRAVGEDAGPARSSATSGIDTKAPNYRSLGRPRSRRGLLRLRGHDRRPTASSSTRTSRPRCPNAKLYGPDGVAEAAFTDPKKGGIPADVGARIKVTVATLGPKELPAGGQKFFDAFKAEVRRRSSRRPVRDLRLRGDAPGPRRDQARRRQRQRPRRPSSRRSSTPRTARACSARTRSTRTATRR